MVDHVSGLEHDRVTFSFLFYNCTVLIFYKCTFYPREKTKRLNFINKFISFIPLERDIYEYLSLPKDGTNTPKDNYIYMNLSKDINLDWC